ncbi:phage DNA packaging protein C, partial [Mycobacterium persicum]|uniref:phage DNA packaging protein C n=1 Tax=Mycobacterium persicum TaxID=1487726 RepID=UPI0015930E1C
HFVQGRDSSVDMLKERGLLFLSDAAQPPKGNTTPFDGSVKWVEETAATSTAAKITEPTSVPVFMRDSFRPGR